MSVPIHPAPEGEPQPAPAAAAAPQAQRAFLPREDPVFHGSDLAIITVAAFFILIFVQVAAVALARFSGRFGDVPVEKLLRDPLILISSQVVAYLLLAVFIEVLFRARYGRGILQAFPFHLPRAFYFLGGGVALAFAVDFVSRFLPIPKQLPIEEFFRTPGGAYAMMFFGVLIAPLVEELYFRGLLYPVLNRRLGAVAGLLLSAAGFALLHAGQLALAWAPLLVLFSVGVVFTLVRARSRSVGPSMLMHMGYNGALFAMIYIGTNGFRDLDKLAR